MTHFKMLALLSGTAILLATSGCAAPQQVAPAGQPAAEEEQRCQFTDAQLTRIRMNALEYLLAEWPVLDALCEEIGTDVSLSPEGSCAISGGPVSKEECPTSSHFGYVITFDEATLLPNSVYWITANR